MASSLNASFRGLISNAHQIPVDGDALLALIQRLGTEVFAAIALPFLVFVIAALAGNLVQHRLVWSAEQLKPKFSKISPLAGPQAAVLKTIADEFREGPDQARAHRHGDEPDPVAVPQPAGNAGLHRPARRDGADAIAVALSARHGGGDHGRRRHCRLHLHVSAMVRAPENVQAGGQGRVQAVRGRSGDQGAHPPDSPEPFAPAHDGGGARGDGGDRQPDPLRGRAQIRARHERAPNASPRAWMFWP